MICPRCNGKGTRYESADDGPYMDLKVCRECDGHGNSGTTYGLDGLMNRSRLHYIRTLVDRQRYQKRRRRAALAHVTALANFLDEALEALDRQMTHSERLYRALRDTWAAHTDCPECVYEKKCDDKDGWWQAS